jgi:hypothetical protein
MKCIEIVDAWRHASVPHRARFMPDQREGQKHIVDPQNEQDLATISILFDYSLKRMTTSEVVNKRCQDSRRFIGNQV